MLLVFRIEKNQKVLTLGIGNSSLFATPAHQGCLKGRQKAGAELYR